MFTGLVSDVGTIAQATVAPTGAAFTVRSAYPAADIALGASICCDGCCLTAVAVTPEDGGGCAFKVEASPETLERTTLGQWAPGRRINLERSLTLADELGGHLVTGHVDGMARIAARTTDGNGVRFDFEAPEALARFVAEKGSVCLDGTSLTVNAVAGAAFSVMLIPHTMAVTTWSDRAAGDMVNIEVDLVARYVARLAAFAPTPD